jgi:hypothetical protein
MPLCPECGEAIVPDRDLLCAPCWEAVRAELDARHRSIDIDKALSGWGQSARSDEDFEEEREDEEDEEEAELPEPPTREEKTHIPVVLGLSIALAAGLAFYGILRAGAIVLRALGVEVSGI